MQENAPILFYDGHCNLCHKIVRFIVKHDKKKVIFTGAPAGQYGGAAVVAGGAECRYGCAAGRRSGVFKKQGSFQGAETAGLSRFTMECFWIFTRAAHRLGVRFYSQTALSPLGETGFL